MIEKGALASARFKVTGKREFDGEEINTTAELELHESGAFDYGNGTCLLMKFEGGDVQLYDTRYEKVSAETFKEYAQEFINNYIAKGYTAEPIA